MPEEFFFMNGVSLCVTVLDHDIVSYNDLAGQALLPLASLPKLKSLSSKHLPRPIVLPLVLPSHPQQYDENFQVFALIQQIYMLIFRKLRYWKNEATKTNWREKWYAMRSTCVHIAFFHHVQKMTKNIGLEQQVIVVK